MIEVIVLAALLALCGVLIWAIRRDYRRLPPEVRALLDHWTHRDLD
jgi:uncharacterized membrane protein YqiK